MLIAGVDVVEELPGAGGWAPLEQLLEFEPGPPIISFLNAVDPRELDESSRVVVMELWERQLAWMSERAAAATATVCGPSSSAGDDDWNAELVAGALGLAPGGARTRVEVARRLTEDLPGCRAAMAAGAMSYRHACVLVEAIAGLDAAAVAAVDAKVAARVAGQDWTGFRRTLRAAVLAADPDLAQAAHHDAARGRDVAAGWLDDGMAEIRASLPAADAQTVWLGLDAAARTLQTAARAAGDADAGIGAYRADALVGWARTALAAADAPTRHGRQAQIQVVIDLPSLLGLAERPAELAGYGPIPASVARELAVDADWRRLVVDPVTGCLLDYGHLTYRPPQKLADFIVARDRRCRFMGCTRKATHCDIDHTVPAAAGATSAANCCCLCRRHHQLKTHGGWTLQLLPDGSCLWTAPNGRRFGVGPPKQLD
jgi:hypothetical protein